MFAAVSYPKISSLKTKVYFLLIVHVYWGSGGKSAPSNSQADRTAITWKAARPCPLTGEVCFLFESEFGHLSYSDQWDAKRLDASRDLNKHLHVSVWALVTLPSAGEHAWARLLEQQGHVDRSPGAPVTQSRLSWISPHLADPTHVSKTNQVQKSFLANPSWPRFISNSYCCILRCGGCLLHAIIVVMDDIYPVLASSPPVHRTLKPFTFLRKLT